MGAGYQTTVVNLHTAAITVNLATAGNTLNGVAAGSISLASGNSITVGINQAVTGYNILSISTYNKSGPVPAYSAGSVYWTVPTPAKTANYTILSSDANSLFLGDTGAGGFTITLPLTANLSPGFSVRVMKVSNLNTLTIARSNTANIYGVNQWGVTSFGVTSLGEAWEFMFDGTDWRASRISVNQTGTVLQVQSATITSYFSTAATTPTDVTGLTVTITPKYANSTILVTGNINVSSGAAGQNAFTQLVRGSTAICIGDAASTRTRCTHHIRAGDGNEQQSCAINFVDSPATVSATTYKMQVWGDSAQTVAVNGTSTNTDSATIGRTASTITVYEIAG